VVEHALEVVDIGYSDSDQRIRVARERERLDQLGQSATAVSMSSTWVPGANRSSEKASSCPPSSRRSRIAV
jgi:hypothetical protein